MTNTWLARTKRKFGGSVLKVVETEKPNWKPSPAPTRSPISLQHARKTGRGTKVRRVAGTPDFSPVQNRQAEERCTGVRVSSDSLPSRVHPSGSQGRRIQNGSVQGHERDQGGSSSASPETGGWGGRLVSALLIVVVLMVMIYHCDFDSHFLND